MIKIHLKNKPSNLDSILINVIKPTAVIKNFMLINDELIHSAWHPMAPSLHCQRTLPKDTAGILID